MRLDPSHRPKDAAVVLQRLEQSDSTVQVPLELKPTRRLPPIKLLSVVLLSLVASYYGWWRTRVTIESHPPQARVFVGRSRVGMTPLSISLPRGNTMIHLASPGRLPVTEMVLLDGGHYQFQANLLEAHNVSTVGEKRLEELMLRPPSRSEWSGDGLPDYYPPTKGAIPWITKSQSSARFHSLDYLVPVGWHRVEMKSGTVLSQDDRSISFSREETTDLKALIEKELGRKRDQGYQVISVVVGEERAQVKSQNLPERCFEVYFLEPDSVIKVQLICRSQEAAGFLVQSIDFLRAHLKRDF